METERLIKKYPNRRLYDTASSQYVTLEDIRQLVVDGVKFRLVDVKTEEDLTRGILLQIILEQEAQGHPLFSNEFLVQVIRSYGHTTQGFLGTYLEESMTVFLRQQGVWQEQMNQFVETGPMSVFTDIAQQNLRIWQSMQEAMGGGFGRKKGE
ncbi:MAG: polyhydroxyalkanoate synthesis repressor PhaR [Pseudomonadota bacterium]